SDTRNSAHAHLFQRDRRRTGSRSKTGRAKIDGTDFIVMCPADMRNQIPSVTFSWQITTLATGEPPVNWDRAVGEWKQLKGRAKEKWGKLTDDDLAYVNGRRDQLLGRIQERYGIAKDQAERQVREWEELL